MTVVLHFWLNFQGIIILLLPEIYLCKLSISLCEKNCKTVLALKIASFVYLTRNLSSLSREDPSYPWVDSDRIPLNRSLLIEIFALYPISLDF